MQMLTKICKKPESILSFKNTTEGTNMWPVHRAERVLSN